jgi:ammonia channel protein AmtB
MALASRIAVNTTLAAAAGGLTALLFETLLGYPGDIIPILNGILSGQPSLRDMRP